MIYAISCRNCPSVIGRHTCITSNVIYAISCRNCPTAVYIGETSQSLRKRLNGHKSDIKNKRIQKPVAEHFNSPNHTFDCLQVCILKKVASRSKINREIEEQKIINKFNCIKLGLNRDFSFLSHYTF